MLLFIIHDACIVIITNYIIINSRFAGVCVAKTCVYQLLLNYNTIYYIKYQRENRVAQKSTGNNYYKSAQNRVQHYGLLHSNMRLCHICYTLRFRQTFWLVAIARRKSPRNKKTLRWNPFFGNRSRFYFGTSSQSNIVYKYISCVHIIIIKQRKRTD